MIRGLFFDVDGTLVSFQNRVVSEQVREDLLTLRARGMKLFLATGRSRQDLARTQMLRDLVFDGYITLNGQCCFNGREIYRDVPICREDLEAGCAVLREHPQFQAMLAGDGFSYLTGVNDRVRAVFDHLHTDLYPVRSPEELLDEKIYQFIPLVTGEEEALFLSRMTHCTYTRWHPMGIDILPQGRGKADGIQATLDYYGLERSEIAAFGDGHNDLTMLNLAGYSVAMGNGSHEVKAVADYITGTVEEDGISAALRHMHLL
ncbi:MAG TPA: Cof-type HAD-IIB family hydrolase [Clostridiales bacterium]|nr:Cof-type HAD-IIB family hydrolase [Clostridiales bacterium]